MVHETFEMFPTCVAISFAIVAISFAISFVAFPRGLFVEFESGVSEELVGCGWGGEHAIFVKLIVALLTSVSLSEAMLLATIAYVRFIIIL